MKKALSNNPHSSAFTKKVLDTVSWGVFAILLATYWLTTAPTVSYWDCPEYVSAAWRLEVGHPPGNPFWMLTERVITMFAPSGKYAALAVNLSSGLFTAFAGFFLARVIFMALGWVTIGIRLHSPLLTRCIASATGALAFGWCDSAWYSAVEAEVYAMSIFMSALCIWLMMKWAECNDPSKATRYLILVAYLMGLSIGVHQLNLLCIPAMVLIWGFKRGRGKWWKVLILLVFSFIAVGVILLGIMPGMIWLASRFELFAVNTCNLPFLSGVIIFIATLGLILIAGLIISSMCNARRLNIAFWMTGMLLVGYSCYALIPIRGDIPSPANSGRPGNPFSFASYLAREQYGASPLIYGHTPMSKPLLREEWNRSDSLPSYRKKVLRRKHPVIVAKKEGMLLTDNYGMLTKKDSALNKKILARGGDGYVIQGYFPEVEYTPELNMWFPRITSRDPSDFPCFEDWAGMNKDNMLRVPVSEAVDSAGNYVCKMNAQGERVRSFSYRPTYMQSLRMFLTYQTGYMYFRYLLWNFSGRQNDIHSTGEVEHGNFITGIPVIDNAMLGDQSALPANAGKENPGRNRYFLIPLLLGLAGMIWLLGKGKRGIKIDVIIVTLFIMTGLAIVVYLNQSPGEPRERDYSFLGSYWAFAMWIGFGGAALMQWCRKFAPLAATIPVFSVIWMFIQNFDDHDRSNRYTASVIASNILNSLPENAIIFVNGDNGTFPLWYAQEVEGIRRDIRVINLAYLGLPAYVESLMRDWNEAPRIPATLTRETIAYGALQFPRLKIVNADSVLDAIEMLKTLEMSGSPVINVDKVRIAGISPDSVLFPLRKLSASGSSNLDFRRLIILDIIATNAASPNPRPIHWLKTMPEHAYAGLYEYTSPALFTRELGLLTPDETEQRYLTGLDKMKELNPNGREPYLDQTPAGQVSIHRAGLVMAATDMLKHGKIKSALRLALASDSLLGMDRNTFTGVHDKDSTFNTRRMTGLLFSALSDSLNIKGERDEAVRLGKRAEEIMTDEENLNREWLKYKRTLSPSLRLKISS